MKNKMIIISILIILFLTLFSQYCLAKYSIVETSSLNVYIDKTPPTINLKSESRDENYSITDLENVIQYSKEVKITTTDNVKIDYNEYCYNPTNKDFTNIQSNKFESETVFKDDGYYKISTIDTSGNRTEMIILIDKTAPDIKVEYFKKGEKLGTKTEVKKVAGRKEYKATENEINLEELEMTNIESNYISLMAAGSTYVYNENDFRNAINNKITNVITVGSINFSSPVYINYGVTVTCANNENALRYTSGGNFLVVQNRGHFNFKFNSSRW